LIYRAPLGRVAEEILYRHDEPRLEVIETGCAGVEVSAEVLPFEPADRLGREVFR
jgi:hypothetical protein